jgi:flagellar secretion chaperone FliS
MATNPYKAQQAYKTTSVQTAGQGRLIVMLFEGAIRFMNQFNDDVKERRIESAHNNSIKAQRIMTELILALDHSKGGEISRAIEAAYDDIRRRMTVSNIRKDVETSNGVIRDLEQFRETWIEVFKKVDVESLSRQPPQSGVSIKT